MRSQDKKAKITREVKRAKLALQSGAAPESVGMSAYVQGWVAAYEQTDACLARKSGWVARYERGREDRVGFDTLSA